MWNSILSVNYHFILYYTEYSKVIANKKFFSWRCSLFFSPPQQEQDVAAVAVVNNTDDKLEDARPIPTPTPAAAAKKNWEPSKSGS